VVVGFSSALCVGHGLAHEWPAAYEAGASDMCSAALRKYVLCTAVSGLFSICHNPGLFESSMPLQLALGCADDPKTCVEKCVLDASRLTNESVDEPCSSDYQAMHGFSAPLNIFTIGQYDFQSNATKAKLLPLPNIKNFGGPAFLSYGDPAHCAEIPTAQYCVLSGFIAALRSKFVMGNCVPSVCTESELSSFVGSLGRLAGALNVNVQCDFVRPVGKATGTSAFTQSFLGWGGVPVEFTNKAEFTRGAAISLAVCLLLGLLVCLGTVAELRREARRHRREHSMSIVSDAPAPGGPFWPGSTEPSAPLRQHCVPEPRPPGLLEGFVNHWSLVRNGRSLMRLRPKDQSDFACMDAVRVFSMSQVILGHMFVYALSSAGYSNIEQFSPPYGMLSNFWFQIVPGCYYGVDSFFVLSGFLCAAGLQNKVFNRRENRRPVGFSLTYVKFALMRWLRLVPAEMFCIMFVVNLLPFLGSGVLWNLQDPRGGHCYEDAGAGECSTLWWTNLLFIQDLDKYMNRCMLHTWYLANDFQLYLTAPFFALAYSLSKRAGWAVLTVAFIVGVIIPIWQTSHYNWVPETLLGGGAGFNKHFYMKPWCRAPAFLIGMAAGWAWPSLERFKGRPRTLFGEVVGVLLSLVGMALCALATFGRASFFQCDFRECVDPDSNPVPRALQYLWAGFGIVSWCLGLITIILLCSLRRFLPLIQDVMNLSMWQPLAKLSYSAYLIHTSVLIMDFCQRSSPVVFSPNAFFFSFVSFVVLSLLAAFFLYLLVEKPASNLQMKILGGGGD